MNLQEAIQVETLTTSLTPHSPPIHTKSSMDSSRDTELFQVRLPQAIWLIIGDELPASDLSRPPIHSFPLPSIFASRSAASVSSLTGIYISIVAVWLSMEENVVVKRAKRRQGVASTSPNLTTSTFYVCEIIQKPQKPNIADSDRETDRW